MKTIYNLFVKDVIRFLNDKPAVILTFVVPMVLIIIFGNVFGGSGGPRGRVPLILVNESNSPLAKIIEARFDSAKSLRLVKTYVSENSGDTLKFDEEKAKESVRTGKISAAVVMPQDFFLDTSASLKFRFYYDPKNEIESSIIQGQMQQIIMTQVPNLMPLLMRRQAVKFLGSDSTALFINEIGTAVGKFFDVPVDSFIKSLTEVDSASLAQQIDTGSVSNPLSELVRFESVQLVGQKVVNPGLTRAVGGWAIMFLLFSITGAATSIFEEKQEGTLKRILCMPVSRSQIMISKYIYALLLGVFQLAILFLFSWAIFDVDIFSNLINLVLFVFVSAGAAVSFGMLITSMAKTLNQANGISTLLILVMSAIGGSWFPISFLPEWMQAIAKMTITYWSVDGFLQILWRQASFDGIATHVAILTAIALLVNFYALIRFRNSKIL